MLMLRRWFLLGVQKKIINLTKNAYVHPYNTVLELTALELKLRNAVSNRILDLEDYEVLTKAIQESIKKIEEKDLTKT